MSAGTAAVLLYIAYVLYCWGSRISNEADRTTEQQQQQQYSPTHAYGAWNEEEFVEPNTFNGGVGGTGEVSCIPCCTRMGHKLSNETLFLLGALVKHCCGIDTVVCSTAGDVCTAH
jgi:hypothetical protein